jgi:hypothetical protein
MPPMPNDDNYLDDLEVPEDYYMNATQLAEMRKKEGPSEVRV